MNEMFVLFAERGGVRWYRCVNCGALTRGTPPAVCPICNGREIIRTVEENEK